MQDAAPTSSAACGPATAVPPVMTVPTGAANSACRSTLGSDAPFFFAVRAMVTVTSASATERRETGAKFGHLASI
jgi:hypothetical protein